MFPLTILNQTLRTKVAAQLTTLPAELGKFPPQLSCPSEALQHGQLWAARQLPWLYPPGMQRAMLLTASSRSWANFRLY